MPGDRSPSRKSSSPTVHTFHHGAIFEDTDALAEYLRKQLRRQEGKYWVVTPEKYASSLPGDTVLFHKSRKFVGEARLKKGFVPQFKRGKPKNYLGYLTFYLSSIKVYDPVISFDDVEEHLQGALSFRGPAEVGWGTYKIVRKLNDR